MLYKVKVGNKYISLVPVGVYDNGDVVATIRKMQYAKYKMKSEFVFFLLFFLILSSSSVCVCGGLWRFNVISNNYFWVFVVVAGIYFWWCHWMGCVDAFRVNCNKKRKKASASANKQVSAVRRVWEAHTHVHIVSHSAVWVLKISHSYSCFEVFH